MRPMLITAAFLATVALMGCTSPSTPYCEKITTCDTGAPTETVSQCETNYDCRRMAMLSAGGNCAKIQNDTDSLASCEAGLACSDLATADGSSVVAQKCNGQYGALAADEAAYGSSCSSVGQNCNTTGG